MALAGFIGILPVLYIPLLLVLRFLRTNRRFSCVIPFFGKKVYPHRAEPADHDCEEIKALLLRRSSELWINIIISLVAEINLMFLIY